MGRWELSKVGDPNDEAMDVRFTAEGRIIFYHPDTTSEWLSGTYVASGDVATGTWKHNVIPNKVWGSFGATTTSATTLTMDFIEEQYNPPKHVPYTGTKTE